MVMPRRPYSGTKKKMDNLQGAEAEEEAAAEQRFLVANNPLLLDWSRLIISSDGTQTNGQTIQESNERLKSSVFSRRLKTESDGDVMAT